MLALLLTLAAATAQPGQPRSAGERTYDRLKPSLFTIEVHSGNEGAKSSLGSGYLVARAGLIATNYHVVAGFIEEPKRYSLRAKNSTGEYVVRLLRFDLVNDLALLQADGLVGEPLRLAELVPEPGSAVVAFGNPGGLGLSLIEGVANGLAAKGLVDRLLLSMPLNAGMSGGPILNTAGEVIGTNVAVMWLSNSLSFGVPVAKLHALIAAPAVGTTEAALLAETQRQFTELERVTTARVLAGFESAHDEPPVMVGSARSRRPGEEFECWDGSNRAQEQKMTWSWFGCNLQFTPSVERVGEVGSVELYVQHTVSETSSFGTFGLLTQQAQKYNKVEAAEPRNGVRSAPRCVADRVQIAGTAWKLTTCVQALVKYPDAFDFELTATSLSAARAGTMVSVRMRGFRLDSFEAVSHAFLAGVTAGGGA
jgi:serine protease Do